MSEILSTKNIFNDLNRLGNEAGQDDAVAERIYDSHEALRAKVDDYKKRGIDKMGGDMCVEYVAWHPGKCLKGKRDDEVVLIAVLAQVQMETADAKTPQAR